MNSPYGPFVRARYAGARVDRRRRRGAVLSIELLVVLPILLVMLLAIVEFGFLWSANHRVHAASQMACRIATLPARDLDELQAEVRAATSRVLQRSALVAQHEVVLDFPTAPPGSAGLTTGYSGEPVVAVVRVPMKAAAPDLLRMFGFGLAGRQLVGSTVMRKE